MARVVGLLAVASKQMLHAEIGSYAEGERNLLLRALGALSAGDLLVLDRGYPAWCLFALFAQRGVAFCARLDSCGYAKVKQFSGSGAAEHVEILTASLDKLGPGRSCPRNFGVNGAQRPRRAYQ